MSRLVIFGGGFGRVGVFKGGVMERNIVLGEAAERLRGGG